MICDYYYFICLRRCRQNGPSCGHRGLQDSHCCELAAVTVSMLVHVVPTLLCSQRSIAAVKWDSEGLANIYRVGHKGKVTKCFLHKLLQLYNTM